MKRKFKVKVRYTFNGYFTLRATSGKEAARLILEQCGTVLSGIQTTLGNESEIDWQFGLHPDLSIRDILVLPETIDGDDCQAYGFSTPGSVFSGVILPAKHRDIMSSVRAMTTRKNPLRRTSFGFILRDRKLKSTHANYAPYSNIIKNAFR